MSPLLNLKLTNLNETILKCSFPVNNLAKYSSLIQNNGYKMRIVDSLTKETHSSADYILNAEIKNFVKEVSSIDSNSLSIREAYSFIDKISDQAKKFVEEMKL